MRLKARVEQLETYTGNLDRKIENIKSYIVNAEDYKKLELNLILLKFLIYFLMQLLL